MEKIVVPVKLLYLLHQYLSNELDCSRSEMVDDCVLAQLYDEFYQDCSESLNLEPCLIMIDGR